MTRPTYLLGDHHGDYAGLFGIPDELSIRDAVVIHVGDGHEGFPECGQPVLERLNQEFATRGIEYLSIRGNHCNPVFFEGNHLLSNLKLLPDYTRLELNGEAWLFVGGAVSVNRIDKIQCGEGCGPQKEDQWELSKAQAEECDQEKGHCIGEKCVHWRPPRQSSWNLAERS